MTLHLGNLSEPITLFGFGNLLFRLSKECRFVSRDAQIIDRY